MMRLLLQFVFVVIASQFIAGFIPVYGSIADGVNIAIHAARENYAEAAWSAVALVPFVGDSIAVIHKDAKILKAADKAIDAVKTADKAGDSLKAAKTLADTALDATKKSGNHVVQDSKSLLKSCFLAGTLVSKYSENGVNKRELVPIESIRFGDKVWSFNHATQHWEPRLVLETFRRNYTGDVVAIQLEEETINATGGHPFWVTSGEDLESRPLCDCLPSTEQNITLQASA
ncbi:MAG: hypothetical protein LBT05_14655 [Planctomycetaceae bacterium]|jgi:hypothetical protein|nr:hypothetical protein [Planctomycetaceae bacterium]